MRRALLIAGALLLLVVVALAGVVLVRALALESRQVEPLRPVEEPAEADAGEAPEFEAVERLAGALRIATVSGPGQERRPAALERFHRYLARSFPRVHRQLERQVVAGHSLLYRWPGKGSGSGPADAPLLLLAHQDVVPAGPDAAERWTHPPFAGAVAEGYLWGRGALDDKGSLLAILEAVEGLLRDGFRPERPVILAFGHDEEVGGSGAQAMARRLAREGVTPLLVLDEGLPIVEGELLGVDGPVALLGVAEKGYLSLELRATGSGGHSSAPPRQTAVDILARALRRLRSRPLPPGIDGPVQDLFTTLAPELAFDRRLVLANLWLFEPFVVRELAADPATDALLRTTTAPTLLSAGVADNVLPAEARAVVNFRLHPRDTAEQVISHVRWAVDDPRVKVGTYGDFSSEASPVSPTDGPAWELLAGSVARVAPEAVAAPSLVLGGTDSRHYAGLTPNVYRFVPFTVRPGDVRRVHGTDERLALEDYGRMVAFYRVLIESAGRE